MGEIAQTSQAYHGCTDKGSPTGQRIAAVVKYVSQSRTIPIDTETLHTATIRVRIIPREPLAFIAAKRTFSEAVANAAEAHEVAEDWDCKGDQVYVAVFSSDTDRDGVFEAAQELSNALAGMDIFKAP